MSEWRVLRPVLVDIERVFRHPRKTVLVDNNGIDRRRTTGPTSDAQISVLISGEGGQNADNRAATDRSQTPILQSTRGPIFSNLLENGVAA